MAMKGMDDMLARMLPQLLQKFIGQAEIDKVIAIAQRVHTWDERLTAIELSQARLETQLSTALALIEGLKNGKRE